MSEDEFNCIGSYLEKKSTLLYVKDKFDSKDLVGSKEIIIHSRNCFNGKYEERLLHCEGFISILRSSLQAGVLSEIRKIFE